MLFACEFSSSFFLFIEVVGQQFKGPVLFLLNINGRKAEMRSVMWCLPLEVLRALDL